MQTKSLAFRLVAGAALWIVGALLAGGLVLSTAFTDYVERAFDVRLRVLLDALVAASDIDEDGALRLSRGPGEPRFDQPYSGWYWQVADESGPLARSRSLWDQILAPDYRLRGMSGYRSQLIGPERQTLRIVAREVTLPGSDLTYNFVVTADTAEIVADIATFNRTLAWSLGALGLGLIIAVLIQVRYGLQPLRRIRAAIAAISSGKVARMEGDFPTEVEPLVDEINTLLDDNAAIVERARSHVGNLAHALKTPLSILTNVIAGEGSGDPRVLAETVRRQLVIMRRQVDHHLARARTAANVRVLGARTEVLAVIDDLARTLERIHSSRAIRVAVEGGAGLYFRGERHDFEEMLGNLADNACKWATSRVRISIAAKEGRLTITVDDDGRGLSPAERETAFDRGERLDEAVPGSGLGLAIVRDIAELYDGAVSLGESELGGLRAELDLPAADTAGPEEKRFWRRPRATMAGRPVARRRV